MNRLFGWTHDRSSWAQLLSVCLVAALLFPGRTWAQQRKTTGRHLPPVVNIPAAGDSIAGAENYGWMMGLFVGPQGGGDFFQVKVDNGAVVPWVGLEPGFFQSSRFKTRFENNANLGVLICRNLNDIWRLRADMSYSRHEISATALVGQGGAKYLYDRIGVFMLGLGIERDLVRLPSAPYLGGAVTLAHLDPSVHQGLAQSSWGGNLTLGFRQVVGRRTRLFLEGRLSEIRVAQQGFSPPAKEPYDPVISLGFRDHVTFFSIEAGIRIGI